MKVLPLLAGALFLGVGTLHAAPPIVIVAPPNSDDFFFDFGRPKPRSYDPFYYEKKSDGKKTTIKRDSAGYTTIKEKSKGKEKIKITDRRGNVIYKDTIKKKKK